jgi:predicted lipid-binding transport protein (Tim44 family)
MSDGTLNNPTPQFGTAEYVGSPSTDHCQYCHQPVPGTYYRINDAMACPACAEKARGELARDTHSAYMRGLLFGIGAAIVGMILYATFEIVTGLIIGYISLAVGWMVGKAITKGSGGVGGRRYQITAALLTYAAVSMAAVPVWIHFAREHKQAGQQKLIQKQKTTLDQRQLESGQPGSNASPTSAPPTKPPTAKKRNFAGAIAQLLLVGIASPFLEVWEGGPSFGWAIGIVILIVGIRIAWRLTAARPLAVYGPFNNSTPPAP